MKKHTHIFVLAITLLLALVLRLYKIDNPIADWHSWRQADTASVTREFFKQGLNLFIPHFQDLSSVPSRIPNPQGYRMVEFPLYNYFHYQTLKLFPSLTLELSGRYLSILFSLISVIYIYLLTQKLTDKPTGLLAAFFFATLPFSIYYGRTILPDPLMITLVLVGSFYFLKFIEKPTPLTFILSSILLSLSLLVRPYAIFFLPPLIWFAINKYQFKTLKHPLTYIFLLITFLPLFLWRNWIQNFPAGIPQTGWLYNVGFIRLRPAWWRWLFSERLGKLILGVFGLFPFLTGLIIKPKKKENFYIHLLTASAFIYLVIFAGGNVTHDYYQFILTPLIAILLAKGVMFLMKPNPNLIWPITPILTCFSVLLMLGLSWYQVKGYYQVNNWSIVEVGKRADEILPKDAKVVAPYGGDTAFLYHINRQGWPIVLTNINDIINEGATHYVSLNYDNITASVIALENAKILEKTDLYIIVELPQE